MQAIQRGGEQRRIMRPVEESQEENVNQRELNQVPEKRGEVEGGRPQAPSDPIIERQRRRYQRAVGLMRRQHTERPGVGEKTRNGGERADSRVRGDRMEVVEMELIAEVIGV